MESVKNVRALIILMKTTENAFKFPRAPINLSMYFKLSVNNVLIIKGEDGMMILQILQNADGTIATQNKSSKLMAHVKHANFIRGHR